MSTLPVNSEPFSADSTLNPKLGDTDAVTLPLAILKGAKESADSGISNRNLPEPLKNEPDANLILPVNSEPLSGDSTLKP